MHFLHLPIYRLLNRGYPVYINEAAFQNMFAITNGTSMITEISTDLFIYLYLQNQ